MLVKLLDEQNNIISVVDYSDVYLGLDRMREAGFVGVHIDQASFELARNMAEKQEQRQIIYKKHDLDSLLGKTANALSATLNLQMQVFKNLATVQTLADVRASVAPALPLMQRVQGMMDRGELLTVQHAQQQSDEDAVVEVLLAMTAVAKIIREQSTQSN